MHFLIEESYYWIISLRFSQFLKCCSSQASSYKSHDSQFSSFTYWHKFNHTLVLSRLKAVACMNFYPELHTRCMLVLDAPVFHSLHPPPCTCSLSCDLMTHERGHRGYEPKILSLSNIKGDPQIWKKLSMNCVCDILNVQKNIKY